VYLYTRAPSDTALPLALCTMLKISTSFGGAAAHLSDVGEYALPVSPNVTVADVKDALATVAGLPSALVKHVRLVDDKPLKPIECASTRGRPRTRQQPKEALKSNEDEAVLSFIDFKHYTDGRKCCRPWEGTDPWLKAEFISVVVMASEDGGVRLFIEGDTPVPCANEATCATLGWHEGRHISATCQGRVAGGHIVVNGHIFDDLGRDITVTELQSACADHFCIPVGHQALLLVGQKDHAKLRLDNNGGGKLSVADIAASSPAFENAGALRLCDLRVQTEASEASAAASWMRSLFVTIAMQDGTEYPLVVSLNTRVGAAVEPVFERIGINPRSVRMLFDGQCVRGDLTFGNYDMENGDCIDVVMEMVGGPQTGEVGLHTSTCLAYKEGLPTHPPGAAPAASIRPPPAPT
jgi:hypothetical protein